MGRRLGKERFQKLVPAGSRVVVPLLRNGIEASTTRFIFSEKTTTTMRDDALYRASSTSDGGAMQSVKLPGEGDLECAKRLCCVECGTKPDIPGMTFHALKDRHNMCFHVINHIKKWEEPERILQDAAKHGNKTALLGILHKYGKTFVDTVVKKNTALMLSCEHGHEQCTRALIQNGADVTKIVEGDDALNRSCKHGHEQCVFALLRAVEDMPEPEKTSFMNREQTKHATKFCTENGYASMLDALITTGATVDMSFDNEKTLLMIAAEHGKIGCVATLLDKHAKLSAETKDGNTALRFACTSGHTECVGMLVDEHKKFPAQSNLDMKALFDMTTESECLWMLLSKGTNISELKGVTSLMETCYTQDTLELGAGISGADANRKTPAGMTALMLSCVKGHHSCVRALLEVDSSPDHVFAQADNVTAWILACRFGHHECLGELIESFRRTGALPLQTYTNQRMGSERTTALMLCAEKGYNTCVQTLLAGEADTTIENEHGNTPLHQAASFGHNNVVQTLIGAKATVHACNDQKLTPLMVACRDGHSECVELLLEAMKAIEEPSDSEKYDDVYEGAYFMAAEAGHLACLSQLLETKQKYSSNTNSRGKTPLILAAQAGHVECVQKLIEDGSRRNVDEVSANTGGTDNFRSGTATYFAFMNRKDHCVRVLLRKYPTTYNHAGKQKTMIQCRLLERIEYPEQLSYTIVQGLSLPHKLALMIDSYVPDVSSGTSSETQTISLIRRSTPEFTSMNHVKHMFVSKWSRQSNVTDRRQSNVTDRILSNPELSNAIQTKMSNAIRDAAMYVEMRDTSRQTPKRPRLYGEQLETSVEQRIAGMSDESKKKHSKDITFTQTELHAVHTDHLKPNDCIKVNDEFFQFQDYDIDSSIVLDPDLVFEHRDYCKESLFTCPALRNWVDVFFTSNANQLMFGKAHLVLIQFNAMFYSPGKGGFSKASQSFDANALMQTL